MGIAQVKVAVLGAGSMSVAPGVLKTAIREYRLRGLELALLDPDQDAVQLLAVIAERLAAEAGLNVQVTTHSRRLKALDGADFVICAASREMHRRLDADRAILRNFAPGHFPGEAGGVAGISHSLRQIALAEEIAADMKRACPRAWLCNACSPVARISQTTYEEGIRTAGFCGVSLAAYRLAWQILHAERLGFPYEPARSRLDATVAGVNRFAWVVELSDAQTGEDLYPALRVRAQESPLLEEPETQCLLQETGYLPAGGDKHLVEFLKPRHAPPLPPSSPTPDREHLLAELRAIADGSRPLDQFPSRELGSSVMSLIAAIAYGRPARLHSLNLANVGQISDLPTGLFVETPAIASSIGPAPEKVDLPPPLVESCRRTAALNALVVRAARRRQRRLVHEAVEADPTVLDKLAARRAIDACIEAHADVLPPYD